MSFTDQPLTIVIGGRELSLGLDLEEPLPRAVVISLFTWRRANPDDDLPGDQRYGCWMDTYPDVEGDRIGSRLWLLSRSALTYEVPGKAKKYVEEALQWLIDDGVATRIDVSAERIGNDTLGIRVQLYRKAGADVRLLLDMRFEDVWRFLNAN